MNLGSGHQQRQPPQLDPQPVQPVHPPEQLLLQPELQEPSQPVHPSPQPVHESQPEQ